MLRVLQVTNMWPTRDSPNFGSFVESQVRSLVETGEVECRVVYARSDYRELRRRAIAESKAWKPDLVHAHFGYTAAAIAFDCRLRGLPLVISYCGGDLHGEVGDWRRRAKTLTGVAAGVAAGFLASRLIVKSDSMLGYLPAMLRSKAEVIPNGVDLERFRPIAKTTARERLGWSQSERVVLFVGRVDDPTKNFALARAAVDLLGAEPPAPRLECLRGVAPDEVPTWLNAADVVLLTSLKEGSPNVVKEACACDVPVVSTPVGDVPTVLATMRSARIAEPDARSVANALRDLIASGERSGESRNRMLALGLDSRAIAGKILSLYTAACGARVAPGVPG